MALNLTVVISYWLSYFQHQPVFDKTFGFASKILK